MTVTTAALRTYVGAQASDDTFITQTLTEAETLVATHILNRVVPEAIHDLAVLKCGSELFNQRKAPNGIAQFATPDGNPVRVARDPMIAAYPILAPYVGLPIG